MTWVVLDIKNKLTKMNSLNTEELRARETYPSFFSTRNQRGF